jgi:4-amino-4-deoxy-L-arabinose transferase-like glycosyltransferase
MGGGRFAQSLAALAVIPVPIYLIMHHWLTMNAFEPLLWMGCLWCVVRAINCGEPRYWFWFGVLTGVGLETKYSIAFIVFGVLVGILLGPERRFLKSSWLWLGMLVAAAVALPNFVWQLQHDFPFLQLLLPRGFIDNVLRLTIDPAPGQIVRVFVGRLEIVTPATAMAVKTAVARNDEATLNKYGRFLEPILQTIRQER